VKAKFWVAMQQVGQESLVEVIDETHKRHFTGRLPVVFSWPFKPFGPIGLLNFTVRREITSCAKTRKRRFAANLLGVLVFFETPL